MNVCDVCKTTYALITCPKFSKVCSQCNLKDEKELSFDRYGCFPIESDDICILCKWNFPPELRDAARKKYFYSKSLFQELFSSSENKV